MPTVLNKEELVYVVRMAIRKEFQRRGYEWNHIEQIEKNTSVSLTDENDIMVSVSNEIAGKYDDAILQDGLREAIENEFSAEAHIEVTRRQRFDSFKILLQDYIKRYLETGVW